MTNITIRIIAFFIFFLPTISFAKECTLDQYQYTLENIETDLTDANITICIGSVILLKSDETLDNVVLGTEGIVALKPLDPNTLVITGAKIGKSDLLIATSGPSTYKLSVEVHDQDLRNLNDELELVDVLVYKSKYARDVSGNDVDMAWVQFLQASLPEFVIRRENLEQDPILEGVRNKQLSKEVLRGEFVSSLHFAEKTEKKLSEQLEDGMYAYSLQLSTERLIGGYIKANDVIDVLLTVQDQNTGTVSTEKIILNAKVLGFGNDLIGDNSLVQDTVNTADIITLQLQDNEIAQLAKAQLFGSVSFALKKETDAGKTQVTNSDWLQSLEIQPGNKDLVLSAVYTGSFGQGEAMSASMIAWQSHWRSSVPDRAILSLDGSFDEIIQMTHGQFLMRDVRPGDFVGAEDFASEKSQSLVDALPNGTYAYPLPISPENRFPVKKNDKINVLITVDEPMKDDRGTWVNSKTILKNARVVGGEGLSSDTETDPPMASKIILALTERQTEFLSAAQAVGSIKVVLSNGSEATTAIVSEEFVNTLISSQANVEIELEQPSDFIEQEEPVVAETDISDATAVSEGDTNDEFRAAEEPEKTGGFSRIRVIRGTEQQILICEDSCDK